MNGAGLWARKVSEAFGMLTGQAGLHCLTMLSWQNVLSARSLLAPVRRWCPDCYAEMRGEHGEAWDLLVWSLSAVACCGRHGRLVEDRCPRCGRLQPWLSSDTPIGSCALCGHDLTRGMPSASRPAPGPYEIWCAAMCGDMVAQAAAGSPALRASCLAEAVAKLVEFVEGGNVSAFARRVGVTPNTVRHWRKAGTIHLDLLLVMCAGLGLRPFELFGNYDIVELFRARGSTPPGFALRGNRWVRRDWTIVGRRFDDCVRECPSIRFKEIAARLGVNEALLRERLRDQVSAWASGKKRGQGLPKEPKVLPARH